MQAMVKRYYDEGHIHQAKTSTLLRLIVKSFLRKRCPEYEQKTSTGYQQEISKLYSDPKDDTRSPQSYQLRTSYSQQTPSVGETTAVKRSTSYADLIHQL